MDEKMFNRLTNNGVNVMDHDFAMGLASNGVFANFLSDGVLSVRAYSRVLTDVVSKTDGITNFSQIQGGGIDIWYNSSEFRLGLTKIVPVRYSSDPDTKGVSVNYAFSRTEMNTVESIQSYLGVHEWQGHIVHGFRHRDGVIHDKAYGLQMKHKSFPKLKLTNPELHNEVIQRYNSIPENWD